MPLVRLSIFRLLGPALLLGLCVGCLSPAGRSCAEPKKGHPHPGGAPPDAAGLELKPVYSGVPYQGLTQHTFTVEGEDNSPCIAFDGRSLVYTSTRNSQEPDVYVKPTHGSALTQLTTAPSCDAFPEFSPDGRRVAFCSNRSGNWDIHIIEVATPGTTWQVTTSLNDDIHPSWSPDGKRLAYCSKTEGEDWELWVVELATRSLTNLGPGLLPVWCPTGDRIAFQRARSRGDHWYGIWTIDIDGNTLTEIVPNDKWAAINPAWSPDGKRLVFASVYKSPAAQAANRTMEADDIYVVSADGSGLMQLTFDETPEWGPCWGRDGRVYFVSRRKGHQNIWSVMPTALTGK